MSDTKSGELVQFGHVIDEQLEYFKNNELVGRLPAIDLLQSQVVLSCVESPSLYRNFSAKFIDNPKADSLTVLIDTPTLADMAEEFSHPEGLNQDDIKRLYIGTGIANLLIVGSFAGAGSVKRMNKFAEALSESQGLYARTMDSSIFDSIQADETARDIAAEGHVQTAHVNATRLTAGMFIEVQPETGKVRARLERTFQDELSSLFTGKQIYIQSIGLFNVEVKAAKDMYSNNVEVLLGLSFPMRKDEVKALLKKLR